MPEGERKIVTALFADLKGSTELMEALDPEEAHAIVDLVLRIMAEAVRRYEGYIARTTSVMRRSSGATIACAASGSRSSIRVVEPLRSANTTRLKIFDRAAVRPGCFEQTMTTHSEKDTGGPSTSPLCLVFCGVARCSHAYSRKTAPRRKISDR